ncbi:unnamed protein product [Bursaphelenchus xylophilus]|uniref:(pine wood nematode) hypothetical protein n=1 Tax=Bursaphelenchus xylophilus TaxID=6326 RepID=A0A1I7RJW2_BURXY|nr:unnamed protein product [Bursaphelenchus xylophilus]CAG9129106.1 unnamed protein product [Bursaphelenchus xylophilus]
MALVIHNAPSLENPFAWDMVDDNLTAFYEPYDELQNLTAFLFANYFITSVGGGIVSFLMLYLVLFKTSGPLKQYRNMLFICCITDLTYWAGDNFMWMKVKEKDGVFILKMEGLAGQLSFTYRSFTMAFFAWSSCFLNAMLPVQFYFRYYSLTTNIVLSASQTLGLCCVTLVLTLPTFFFTYASFTSSPNERPGFNYGQLWYQEFPLPPLLFGDVRSIYQKGFFFWAGMSIAGSYLLMIHIGRKTLQFTSKMDASYSERTRRLQRQLTNFMFVQATIPLFVSVIPSLTIVIPAFLYIDTGRICCYCVLATSWIPVLNPIITIVVIVPFRRAVCGAFQKKSVVNSTTSNPSLTAIP